MEGSFLELQSRLLGSVSYIACDVFYHYKLDNVSEQYKDIKSKLFISIFQISFHQYEKLSPEMR